MPPKLLADIDCRTLWLGAVAGGALYLLAFLASLALAALTIAGVAASARQQTMLLPAAAIPETSLGQGWSILGQFAAQLIPLAHLGVLSTTSEGSVPFLGQVRIEASASAVPLVLLAICLAAAWFSGRIAEGRVSSVTSAQVWAQSIIAGGVFSVLTTSVAAVASVNFPAIGGLRVEPVSAAGLWPLIVAFVAVTGMSWLGRRSSTHVKGPGPKEVQDPGSGWSKRFTEGLLPAVGAHVVVFFLIAVPTAWIVAGAKLGWAGALSAPLWVVNVAGYLFVDGHLGGLHGIARTSQLWGASGTSSSDGYFYGVAGTMADVGLPTWAAWLLVLLSLVSVAVSSAVLLFHRGHVPAAGLIAWLPVPLAFAALGLVATVLLGAGLQIDMAGMFTADYSFGAASWFVAVMAFWGVLVEAGSRYLAPFVLPYLPVRFRAALSERGGGGRTAMKQAGFGTPSAAGSASDVAATDIATTTEPGDMGSLQPLHNENPAKTPSPKQRKRILAGLIAAFASGCLRRAP
ncbi:hypothetical protein [Arthrobacter sp. ISL-30]|uniref:hypothetical protein n=1 Tax=Arthrobacter sp. ISL-30 TaxID=2819109 RepID=UPI001BE9445A|nr:hypothetical protein [Arthrobacter sp. ISL-30]MBT2513761.1 hypothetical protein [Arthrobacter sp. ISL-30]